DARCTRKLELLVDTLSIPGFCQRRSQIAAVEGEALGQAREHVGRGDVQSIGKVRAVHGASKRLAVAVIVCPQRRLVRGKRVVPVTSCAVRQAFGRGDLFEARPRRGESLRRSGDRLALRWYARVELESTVLHLQVIRLPQPVDPSLADVAP